MRTLTYQEQYSSKSFLDLIGVFGEWKSESEIQLNPETGSGTIQMLDIEPGVQVRLWDCTFNDAVTINRARNASQEDRTYTLVYYLTPGTFEISKTHSGGGINQVWNTVLMTSDAEFDITIKAGRPMKCLSVNFTPAWIEKNIFCDADFQDHFFRQQLMDPKPFVLFESNSQNERNVIDNLFQNRYHHSFGKFFFRSKALNLLTEFFLKMNGRVSLQYGTSLYHQDQMLDAEKMLMENIGNSLPCLKKMAQDLCISESTLKRYFKKIHGKNISEYFLQKKMDHARQLLDEQKGSVTEVAYMVGYEKVSQFICTFKKYHGMQPGAYKQTLRSVA